MTTILDGLTSKQISYLQAIRNEAVRRKLPAKALVIAYETVLVESGIQMYANGNNPESLQLPHDKVGYDHGSVGLFQQQVGGAVNSTANWGTTRELMNPTISAAKFFAALTQFNYAAMTTGEAAQRVQGSAFPDRYQQHEATAIQLANALWAGNEDDVTPELEQMIRDMHAAVGDIGPKAKDDNAYTLQNKIARLARDVSDVKSDVAAIKAKMGA